MQQPSSSLGIILALIASLSIHAGKVLQRQGVKILPRFSLEPSVLREFWRNRVYLFGLLLDIGGGIVTAAAISQAPVSIVQPVVSSGLVFVALYSHFILNERLSKSEWAACLWAIIGLGLLSGVGVAPSEQTHGPAAQPLNVYRIFPGLLAAAWLLLPSEGTRLRFAARFRSLGLGFARRAAAQKGPSRPALQNLLPKGVSSFQGPQLGLLAGACFGLSGSNMKVGFLLLPSHGPLATLLAIACSLGLTSRGVYLQTLGFKSSSSALHIITLAAGGSMIVSILCGLLLLGEPFADSPLGLVSRVVGWVLVTAGILVMGRADRASSFAKSSAWTAPQQPTLPVSFPSAPVDGNKSDAQVAVASSAVSIGVTGTGTERAHGGRATMQPQSLTRDPTGLGPPGSGVGGHGPVISMQTAAQTAGPGGSAINGGGGPRSGPDAGTASAAGGGSGAGLGSAHGHGAHGHYS